MTESSRVFRVGTRGSNLALFQARQTIWRLRELFKDFLFEERIVSSPGDRDRQISLRDSPQDFFTRDLDGLILEGQIECAVHSAKDLPDPVPAGIDWFWLPWREDPRDLIVMRRGESISVLPACPVIGVSSDRREEYCKKRFPEAQMKGIRGNIEERIEQLDSGDYDIVIIAGAAMLRLGLHERITEWIPIDELPSPEGQGVLAVTFKAGDPVFQRIRSYFVKAVSFTGAGIGNSRAFSAAAIENVSRCEVCLHDLLLDKALLDYVPKGSTIINVGKRSGAHTVKQKDITQLLIDYARKGKRVVRLKGGDPGVFGRLAEETDALDALALPHRVIPGVSSLSMATTRTGKLLTRRGVSRGFCVITPRLSGGGYGSIKRDVRSKLPIVLFMAVEACSHVANELIEDGFSKNTPASVVFNGGSDEEEIVTGRLDTIGRQTEGMAHTKPGLLIIGDAAADGFVTTSGALSGARVLLTCSEAIMPDAACRIFDYGGVPVCRPMIKLEPAVETIEYIRNIGDYEWIVLTSPSAVRCLFQIVDTERIDIRSIPKVMSCGPGTTEAFRRRGIIVDLQARSDFSAEGLISCAKNVITDGTRILRLRSSNAGTGLTDLLRVEGAVVDDCVLYRNSRINYESLPEFEAVFFASASAVNSFTAQWPDMRLQNKTVLAIGSPTEKALLKHGIKVDMLSPVATVEGALTALAGMFVRKSLEVIV